MKLLFFVLGTLFGSFFGLVADRLPQGRSLLVPRSHCEFCQHVLQPLDLIPLISIIRCRFRCRYCGHKLAARYFWCELLTGLLFAYVSPLTWSTVWLLAWLSASFVLALIDADHLIVETRVFLFSSLLLLLSAIWLAQPLYWWHVPLVILSYAGLQLLLPASLGRGDLWLLAFWSLFLTWYAFLLLLVIASFSGLVFYGWQKLQGKVVREIPFVPFLALGLTIVQLVANVGR